MTGMPWRIIKAIWLSNVLQLIAAPSFFTGNSHIFREKDDCCAMLCCCSVISDCAPPTVAWEGPLSVKFSRQGCWSGLPLPSPGDLPNPGIEPSSLALQADSVRIFHLVRNISIWVLIGIKLWLTDWFGDDLYSPFQKGGEDLNIF